VPLRERKHDGLEFAPPSRPDLETFAFGPNPTRVSLRVSGSANIADVQQPHWLCSKLSHVNPDQKMKPTARTAYFAQILVRSTKVGRAAENMTQEVRRC
jgi:hypothetical protein